MFAPMYSMMRFSAGLESRYTTCSVAPAVSFAEVASPLRWMMKYVAAAIITTSATKRYGHLRRLVRVNPCVSGRSESAPELGVGIDSSMLMTAFLNALYLVRLEREQPGFE